ncbi:unnamed protein product [Echinostoma caproni]|uniref:Secreted protein n=1 Tax=Echinostoma caproni TaxID=27848 RepID=A0A183AMR5_9TREM|nr:unnamed protein product [Echinostoma caproni]
MLGRLLPGLCMLAFLMTQTAATPFGMFDPQAEYINFIRVDNALERCIQLISTQSTHRMGKLMRTPNLPGTGAFNHMEQLRKCMLQEFADKVPSNRWNMV